MEALMLEKIDLNKEMKRKEWKAAQSEFQRRLYDLQKAAFDNRCPSPSCSRVGMQPAKVRPSTC